MQWEDFSSYIPLNFLLQGLYSAFQPLDLMMYQIANTTKPAYCVFMWQLLNICSKREIMNIGTVCSLYLSSLLNVLPSSSCMDGMRSLKAWYTSIILLYIVNKYCMYMLSMVCTKLARVPEYHAYIPSGSSLTGTYLSIAKLCWSKDYVVSFLQCYQNTIIMFLIIHKASTFVLHWIENSSSNHAYKLTGPGFQAPCTLLHFVLNQKNKF